MNLPYVKTTKHTSYHDILDRHKLCHLHHLRSRQTQINQEQKTHF